RLLIGRFLFSADPRGLSLLLAFHARETNLRVFGVGADALHLVAEAGDFSARVPQLLVGAERVTFRQFAGVTLIIQFALQTGNLLICVVSSALGGAHGSVAALDFFTPLARGLTNQRHVFSLRAAARRLACQDIDLAFRLAHAQGALGLFEIGFRSPQFSRRVTVGAGITREIHSLTRAQQSYGNVAKVCGGDLRHTRIAEIVAGVADVLNPRGLELRPFRSRW